VASRSLGTLTVDLVAKIGGFTKGMTQAEREADKGAKAVEARMRKLAKGIDAAFQVAAAAVVAAVGVMAVGVNNAINRMDDIGKSAQKVGISAESFSKLAYAAQLADVDIGQLEGGLAKLAKSQDAAAQGAKEQLDIFRALGVEFQNADGTLRKTDEVFADLADRFQGLPDGANKTAAAMALLGRSGAQMIPLLNGGSDGLREMGDELERFGGVVGPEAARQAETYNDNLTRLRVAADGLWQSLAMQLLPDLIHLTEEMLDASKKGGDLRDVVDAAATFVRGLGMAAQLAVDGVQALTYSAIGLYNVMQGISRLSPGSVRNFFDGRTAGDDFRDAGVAFGMAGSAFDETSASLYGDPNAKPKFDWAAAEGESQALAEQAKRALAAAEAEKALAKALAEARTEQERAAAAAKTKAEADREAAKAAREAEAEAKRIAAEKFEERMDLVKMAAQERKDREDEKKRLKDFISDLEFEVELMKMGNVEREKAIALRYANVDAASAEGIAIGEAIEAQMALGEQISAMDEFRMAFEDNVASVLDGSKSIKDAFTDLADSVIAQIARMIAKQWTAQLFGDMGTTGSGSAGGGWMSALFSAFGGPRAAGGPMYPGKAYLVGEEGPELVRPMGAGTVVPAKETASLLGGRMRGGDTFIFQGATSGRSVDRLRMERTRADRRAEAEFG